MREKQAIDSCYLRRQFLFCDQAEVPFEGWMTRRSATSYLHHHPDLPVRTAQSRHESLMLAGFAIDPAEPGLSEERLLDQLFALLSDRAAFIRRAQTLAGRWVLFAEGSAFSIALHDACGLRPLFYSDGSLSPRFCASQDATAAKVFDLEKDRNAAEGFEATEFARKHPEYWWPGDATAFRGVRALLPNHYLDLRTREVVRYGPSDLIGELSVRDASERAAKYLRGVIQAAAHRYELALALTAGWDSRALLAGCRDAGVRPYCYTLRFGAMAEGSQDIAVPTRLLKKFQWSHHIIDCAEKPTDEFIALYKSNISPAHDEACQLAFGLWKEFPKGKVMLSGHCSEIARTFYKLSDQNEVSSKDLTALAGMEPTDFVLNHFERWLAGARPASNSTGIALLDLFYWEQRAGRWAANGQSQWDLVHERFAPFNCRPVLFTLLAVPARYRRAPDYQLYRNLIQRLDPSALSEPINPDTSHGKTSQSSKWMRLKRLIVSRSPRDRAPARPS